MNLSHLYYFRTLAEVQHYTRAAEKLFITQPTLSNAVSQLEKELGIPLFEKDGRNVKLTKQGREFNTYVSQALDLIDKAVDVTKTWAAPPRRKRPATVYEGYSSAVIADCPYFTVNELRITDEASFPASEGVSYTHLLCTEGDAALIYDDGVVMPVSKGESVFLPANFGAYTIRSKNCVLLATQTLPRR